MRIGQPVEADGRRVRQQGRLSRHGRAASAPAPARRSRCCRRRTPPATGSRSCSACRCASRSTRRSSPSIRCASACRWRPRSTRTSATAPGCRSRRSRRPRIGRTSTTPSTPPRRSACSAIIAANGQRDARSARGAGAPPHADAGAAVDAAAPTRHVATGAAVDGALGHRDERRQHAHVARVGDRQRPAHRRRRASSRSRLR